MGHDQAMGLTVLPTEVRDRLAGTELTYRDAGATAGNLPAGYHQFSRSLPIGYGHQLFAAAGDAVRQWQVQLGAGLQVSASSPNAVAGTVRATAWPRDRLAPAPGAMPGRVCRGRASVPWLRIRHAGRAPGKRRGSLHDRASRRRLGELQDHGVLQASYAPGQDRRPARRGCSTPDHRRLPPVAGQDRRAISQDDERSITVSIPVTRSTQRLFGRARMPTTSTRPSVPLKSSGLAV